MYTLISFFILLGLLLRPTIAAAALPSGCAPSGFIFGTSTSAYQIEGAWNESGKGENIFDNLFHAIPQVVVDGSNGDVAADSYHNLEEDIRILKESGVNFYRFSLSWSRILPNGLDDEINPAGVEYYNTLLTRLQEEGIGAAVTLYHWDLPYTFSYLGSWSNEQLVQYFTKYADVAFRLFGDKVQRWITFNEPFVVCTYIPLIQIGIYPSYPRALYEYLCTHTVILAHAEVYHLYKSKYKATKGDAPIGFSLNQDWYEPASNSSEDIEAAERRLLFQFGWYAHPLVYGDYPAVVKETVRLRSAAQNLTAPRLPEFTSLEKLRIKGAYDYFGLNHYTTFLTSQAPEAPANETSFDNDVGIVTFQDPSWPSTGSSHATTYKVVPWGLRSTLVWIKNTYGNPKVLITENGFAGGALGGLVDPERANYFREYIRNAILAKVVDRVNLIGYTAWSLMDNFEWFFGYQVKFGLFEVDFDSPERTRTARLSAECYRNISLTNCADSCIIEE